MLVNILVWVIVGAIAGWLASQIMHSRLGLIGDIILVAQLGKDEG